MNSTKKYYSELNIFRALIIVWVVIGHSLDSELGGFFSQLFKSYAYSFHMNAFFVLSGFLFASKLGKTKKVKDKAILVKDRFLRLIIPYLFFTVVSYVLKLFLEGYAYNSLEKNPKTLLFDILTGINNPNGGIWFLHTLFVISVIFVIINFLPDWVVFVFSLGLKCLTLFLDFDTPVILNICLHSVFFSAGVLLYKNYDKITEKFNAVFLKNVNSDNKQPTALYIFTLILVTASVVLCYFLLKCNDSYLSNIYKLIVCIFNIATWYFVAQSLNNTNRIKKLLMCVGNYGMDIYMIGYYVQITLRVILLSMLGVPYVIYSIIIFILGLVLPIPISKYIVRKFKITRALVLGDFKK
ncbi:MAG: acyltransferase family protein [Eubacterium sp.]